MPHQPSNAQVHVDRPLTDISVAFIQADANFVATRVAPTVPVAKRSDRYFTYDRGDFWRDSMKKRAPGTESAGSGYNVDNTPTFYCEQWSLHKDVPWALRDNADMPLNMERDATIYLTQQGLIRKEKLFSQYMATTVWTAPGTDTAPTTKWDAANSTPIKDMRAGITAVHKATGMRANTVVMGQAVFDVLVDHPDTVDRVKYGTQTGVSTFDASELAQILKVPNLLIMGGVENTAAEGATNAFDFIGGTDTGVFIGYVAPSPGIMIPSALYTFAWTEPAPAGEGVAISTFPQRNLQSDRVEADMYIDVKVIASDCGFFLPDVLG